MDFGQRWVLLQVYFKTETGFLGKNWTLEHSGSVLAALDPLCCSGCPWAAGSVEHLLCCYGNTSSGVPGKATEMVFVEWHVKSGFAILLREISTLAFAAMLWIQDVWRCNLCWEQILFISMWNYHLGAVIWDVHLHPLLCSCSNSLMAAQDVRNQHSHLPKTSWGSLNYQGLQVLRFIAGSAVLHHTCFALLRCLIQTNSHLEWYLLFEARIKTHEVKSWGVLGWECADKPAPVQLHFGP